MKTTCIYKTFDGSQIKFPQINITDMGSILLDGEKREFTLYHSPKDDKIILAMISYNKGEIAFGIEMNEEEYFKYIRKFAGKFKKYNNLIKSKSFIDGEFCTYEFK